MQTSEKWCLSLASQILFFSVLLYPTSMLRWCLIFRHVLKSVDVTNISHIYATAKWKRKPLHTCLKMLIIGDNKHLCNEKYIEYQLVHIKYRGRWPSVATQGLNSIGGSFQWMIHSVCWQDHVIKYLPVKVPALSSPFNHAESGCK